MVDWRLQVRGAMKNGKPPVSAGVQFPDFRRSHPLCSRSHTDKVSGALSKMCSRRLEGRGPGVAGRHGVRSQDPQRRMEYASCNVVSRPPPRHIFGFQCILSQSSRCPIAEQNSLTGEAGAQNAGALTFSNRRSIGLWCIAGRASSGSSIQRWCIRFDLLTSVRAAILTKYDRD